MFKDGAFNASVLISIVWHLFWISAVGIAVAPEVRPGNAYPEIGFLGPILEKTAFDLMAEEVKPQSETLYARSAMFLDSVHLKPEGPGRKVLKEFMPEGMLDRFTFSLHDYVKDTKEVPLYLAGGMKMIRAKSGDNLSRPFVEGPAAEREIIFRPGILTVPLGLYGEAEEYAVKLRFAISDNGLVCDVEPVISSGYLEIDLSATRFLKKWRFSPLRTVEKEKTRPSAWGAVTVKVIAK